MADNRAKNQILLDGFEAELNATELPVWVSPLGHAQARALIAELRAARRVVEAGNRALTLVMSSAELSNDEATQYGLDDLSEALEAYDNRE